MFNKMAVVFDESPGTSHALTSAIAPATTLGPELQTVTVIEPTRRVYGIRLRSASLIACSN